VSEQNLKIVRGMYEAFNRREVDRSREALHPASSPKSTLTLITGGMSL
jgi:hypothetical protein